MPIPSVGTLAPDFSLPSTSGSTIALSSLRGTHNVLLAFFPFAFSGPCTEEMCSFSEDFDQFASKAVTVLPISVDSMYALKEFKSKHNMQLDLLSDFLRSAAETYGVLIPEKQFARRSYFVIDKQGTIRWAHVEDNNAMRRQNTELLAAIAALG